MNIAEKFVAILFICIGTFSWVASLFNWDWFFKSHNASIFLRWFGRQGARWFYGAIGIIVMVIGFMMLFGYMQ
ncbi:MAG: immunity 17 family protein [Bacteroidales bacterium]